MNKSQLLNITILSLLSPVAFAAGSHSGGHDDHQNPSMEAHWMSPPAEAAKPNPIKLSKQSVNTGAKLYQQYCTSCHGANAEGDGMAGMMLDPKPTNLRAMSGGHPDGDFAYKIREGRGAMPSWKNTLNENQVWHLVNFIQTLDKQSVAKKQSHGHSDSHSHAH